MRTARYIMRYNPGYHGRHRSERAELRNNPTTLAKCVIKLPTNYSWKMFIGT